jgi:protein-S-isoprenylcysteine O-methyltransferase Ste14
MWLLDRYAPIAEANIRVLQWAGIALIALGAALALWCAREFRRAGTPIVPFLEPTALVTRGPYRISRNPIYVGFTLALIGVAALLGSSSPFVVVPVFVWIMHRRFVEPEERLLEHRFGEVYRAYKAQVRPWI